MCVVLLFQILFFSLFFSTFSFAKDYEEIFFHVYRNDSKIGFHKLKIENNQNSKNVEISINFKVKFLGFTLYDYDHKNFEKWIGNDLVKVNSKTNKNGDLLNCTFVKNENSSKILGTFNPKNFPENLISTSYWNVDLVRGEKKTVLNTQDCNLIDFKIDNLGIKKIYNNKILTTHYKLTGKESSGEDLNIDIWYDMKGNWVKMIFLKDNSSIEYFLDKFHEE